MTIRDTCDARLHFFGQIARENNKGKEMGGRVKSVTIHRSRVKGCRG
jgi:hypothetical protein